MFVLRPQVVTAALLVLTLAASTALAQQPQSPSQRFSPERSVPPSVHVPAPNTRPLKSQQAPAQSNATSFNFSDTPVASFRTGKPNNLRSQNGSARQVSYTEEVRNGRSQLPEIPAVLREYNQSGDSGSSTRPASPPAAAIHSLRPPARNSVSDTGQRIVVSEKEFESHNRKAAVKAQRPAQPMASRSKVQTTAFSAPQSAQTDSNVRNAVAAPSAQGQQVKSAEFNTTTTPISAPRKIAQVSAESEAIPGASIQMSTPAIRVQAFGPESIGINKIATYKITVSNDGNRDAESLQVGIGLPTTVDLQNVNVSTGHHESTDSEEQSRLVWKIDRIAAKTTHTIAINAIPRTAERFDMNVEWMFVPRASVTSIQVTQPQLEMKIAGPTEVLYGEKATYDVTVYNPGTGVAEKVSVMLPEELGGERANIGDVAAGGEKQFKVELFARTAGELSLAATAVGAGNIETSASHDIRVRRAKLSVDIQGPAMKYAGSVGEYTVTVANDGDATASNVTTVLAMPSGVKYLNGVNNVESSDNGMKWKIGTMTSGDRRTFKVNCQLDASGNLMFQAGARGKGDLAATGQCQTQVDTVADLTLHVEDPKGPLPTAENTTYKIVVKNRGTRSANGVNIVMQFSEGIEPVKADGFKSKIVTGQVIFSPIGRIDPGQEVVLNVTAQAQKRGTHIFRAQLTCEESDSREIAEGTTKFFGEEVAADGGKGMGLPTQSNTAGDIRDFK